MLFPVEYHYDYAGRMTVATTWKDFEEATGMRTSGTATTQWVYDSARGWLNQKQCVDSYGPTYTYTAAGRLQSRAWVRGITTWYTNQPAGELSVVNCSDSTPDVTHCYDRRGRMTDLLQVATSLARSDNDAANLLRESYTGGPLNGP